MEERKKLTEKQDEIYKYMCLYIVNEKKPVTYRKISEKFKITYKGSYDHVKALNKKGWIFSGTIPKDINVIYTAYNDTKI